MTSQFKYVQNNRLLAFCSANLLSSYVNRLCSVSIINLLA